MAHLYRLDHWISSLVSRHVSRHLYKVYSETKS